MNAPTHMNLEAAMDLADHASPAPLSASLALKVMRAEIQRLRSAQEKDEAQDQHPDDIAVDRFAAALKAKLADARAKGRSGWQDKIDCPQQRLSNMLRDHVEKGDPRDVGAFCTFLHQRGESILPKSRTMLGLAAELLPKHEAQEKAEPAARDMASAPRDGTLVRLLVRFTNHALHDDTDPQWTIGQNGGDHTGEDRWEFAGWSWEQDCFTSGEGEPIAWLPCDDAPPVARERMPEEWREDIATLLDAVDGLHGHGATDTNCRHCDAVNRLSDMLSAAPSAISQEMVHG